MVVPNEEPKKPTKPKKPAKLRKSRKSSLAVPVPTSAATLNVINPDAAGIDVHSNLHMVCVSADRDANPVRQFGANTADLQEMVAWLKKCRIKTVALESSPKSLPSSPGGWYCNCSTALMRQSAMWAKRTSTCRVL